MLERLLAMFKKKRPSKEEPSMDAFVHPEESVKRTEEAERQEEPKKWRLYSCPFCSSNVLSFLHQAVATGSRWDGQHWTLCCEGCGAKGPFADTKEECADKWNECALMQERNKLAEHCNKLEEEMDKLKKEDSGSERLAALESLLQSSDGPFKTFEWKTATAKPSVKRTRPSCIGSGRKMFR